MKQLFKLTLFLLIITLQFTAQGQRVRRPFEVDGSGTDQIFQWPLEYGFSSSAVAPKQHYDPDVKEKKNKKKEPAILTFKFKPFDAQQLCIIENYNPGAITKIEIGYQKELKGKLTYNTIYEGATEEKPKEWTVSNYMFETLPNVQEVIITMDYLKVDGINQIGGVILTDFKDKFEPKINVPDEELFIGKALNMNDDISGKIQSLSIYLTANGKKMLISYSHDKTEFDRIGIGEIGSDGKFKKVSVSALNLPIATSTASGLLGFSLDNSTAYVNDMGMTKFPIYKVYTDKKGRIKYKRIIKNIGGFDFDSKQSNELNYIMSFDGKVIIAAFPNKKVEGKYNSDMHVSFKNEKGKWSDFVRMTDDINTVLGESPTYLAPDNKTLFYASQGQNGYGTYDLFMTQRLDDTWLNWSYPINLGNTINTEKRDKYITFDTYNNYAYITRINGNEGDIFRYKMREIKTDESEELVESVDKESIKPQASVKINQPKLDPTILVDGIVIDKKTRKPVEAEILFYDINTKKVLGNITSNHETGEYAIILKKGLNYSFEANAENYMSESYNLDLTNLKSSKIIKQNIELTPILKGETLRLNNIFFETASYELKSESFLELDKLANILSNNKKMKIEIQGHTDNVGNDQYNLTLSNNRAKSVVEYLLSKNISPDKLSFKGYGKNQPLADNNTEEGRALNRRVEMKIIEN